MSVVSVCLVSSFRRLGGRGEGMETFVAWRRGWDAREGVDMDMERHGGIWCLSVGWGGLGLSIGV